MATTEEVPHLHTEVSARIIKFFLLQQLYHLSDWRSHEPAMQLVCERHATGGIIHTPNILTTTTPCVCALSRRAKLPLLSVEQAQARFMGPGAPKDVLAMLCVLGDWNPVCARLETQQLQAGLWELKQEAAANSGSDAAHIQVGIMVGTMPQYCIHCLVPAMIEVPCSQS